MPAEVMKMWLSKTELSFKLCLQCLWKQIYEVYQWCYPGSLYWDYSTMSRKMNVTVTLTVTSQVECETHTVMNTWRQSRVVTGQRCATLASDPSHTPPQQHSSIFHPPPTHTLLQVCLQLNGGGGASGPWGYQVSFKKAVVRTGWKWSMTLFRLNCSLVKTVWPHSALPAPEFLYSSKSWFNGIY